MKYSYLHNWTRSLEFGSVQVETIHKHEDSVVLKLSNGKDLRFVFCGREAFAYVAPGSPMVETLLWPHLRHARIEKIELDPADRILYVHLMTKDIYQQVGLYILIAELTPPRPNLILARSENNRWVIEDALHKYGLADNPQRQVLPRLEYQAPQTAFVTTNEEVRFPLHVTPADGSNPIAAEDMNSYFMQYHDKVLRLSAWLERLSGLRSKWEKELRKCEGKLRKQRTELEQARLVEHWLACAEAIKYNLSNIRKGQLELVAVNYLDPNLGDIKVPLSVDKSPRENMDLFLRKYRKARNGQTVIEGKIKETEAEIRNIHGTLEKIAAGEDTGAPGLVKGGIGSGALVSSVQDKLLRLRINTDFEIVIGRKAKENDLVTTQLARPHDWWFHTRIYHGGHVLLRCLTKKDPDDQLVETCCGLAAWYSKARFSANVPVDYTQIRFVRKPRRSPPGFVTYTTHQTVFATPIDFRAAKASLGL